MKNFLLSGDRTGERKIKEIILASRIEETLSKDKILELYLNEIFLGQNSYGVAAAAQTYFNKPLALPRMRRLSGRCPGPVGNTTPSATRTG
jgi:penicillin-binding protein 1A